MTRLRATVAVILVAALLPCSRAAADQRTADGPIKAAALREASRQAIISSPPHHGRNALVGALVGAGGAAAVTYWAAKNYGENEPGGFCGGCFAAWGAWTIPAGALVGGVVGSIISHAAAPQYAPRGHQAFITPVAGRRGAGVVVAVRY